MSLDEKFVSEPCDFTQAKKVNLATQHLEVIMDTIVNILGSLIIVAFAATCLLGFLFGANGIYKGLKKRRKHRESNSRRKN